MADEPRTPRRYGLSPVNVDRVDLERFPLVASTAPYVAHVRAGDALFIPDGWWHATLNLDESAFISSFVNFRHAASGSQDEEDDVFSKIEL